uniref:4-hydroxyphenylpyruvate dioxygenase n=1 Tax=Strongyloides venezuelensis TaxID=75913 RepID=A0A0K0EZR4_STRVS
MEDVKVDDSFEKYSDVMGSYMKEFHHVEFYVVNAVQTAQVYCILYGFEMYAICREDSGVVRYAIRNGPVILVFCSKVGLKDKEWDNHIIKHGDSIKDIAFKVNDIDKVIDLLKKHIDNKHITGVSIEESIFHNGKCIGYRIQYDSSDIVHTLYDPSRFDGFFLPGFMCFEPNVCQNLPKAIEYLALDHVVQNHHEGTLEKVADYYKKSLGLNRFWSIDDKTCHSEYSAMNAWLVVNVSKEVQMTIAEPVTGTRRGRGQIQEFLDFHGGPGIQHLALRVENIIETVTNLKKRGVQFLSIPDEYYYDLKERLKGHYIKIYENLDDLQRLNILVDFDDKGYLLQIFTKPVQDRPTLFLEIIQRENFNGFGAGNFKSLFEALEAEQKKRGTLFC